MLTDAAREANFTNEGGVDGTVRFLTNVMGLWLLSETIRTWERAGDDVVLTDLLAAAADVTGDGAGLRRAGRAVPAAGRHARPDRHVVPRARRPPPGGPGRRASAASSRAWPRRSPRAVRRAGELSGREVRVVHLVGGGALNRLLCQLTADRCGLPVLAGPVEATALGNVLVQARTAGALTGDLSVLRHLVATTQEPQRFVPRPRSAPGSARVGS